MKKAVSVILCACMLMLALVPIISAGALSIEAGPDALNASMPDGECPGGLDYVYFAPETAENTKYPLVIWLHGKKSGEYKRAQLEWYEFSNWSSDEYQARNKSEGGMFLLLPRSSISSDHNWHMSDCGDLKKTIDWFISLYPDKIDTSRIYISGYSTGGSMVLHMLDAYPDFFAAAMPICPLYSPTLPELNKLKDVSVWFFSCDKDPYVSASSSSVSGSFNYLAGITERPEDVRHTAFSQAVWPDGSKQQLVDAEHYIWGAVFNDMFMKTGEQYAYSTTKDATGKIITFTQPDGIISWLTQQEKSERTEKQSFFEKIAEFLSKILQYIISIFR